MSTRPDLSQAMNAMALTFKSNVGEPNGERLKAMESATQTLACWESSPIQEWIFHVPAIEKAAHMAVARSRPHDNVAMDEAELKFWLALAKIDPINLMLRNVQNANERANALTFSLYLPPENSAFYLNRLSDLCDPNSRERMVKNAVEGRAMAQPTLPLATDRWLRVSERFRPLSTSDWTAIIGPEPCLKDFSETAMQQAKHPHATPMIEALAPWCHSTHLLETNDKTALEINLLHTAMMHAQSGALATLIRCGGDPLAPAAAHKRENASSPWTKVMSIDPINLCRKEANDECRAMVQAHKAQKEANGLIDELLASIQGPGPSTPR